MEGVGLDGSGTVGGLVHMGLGLLVVRSFSKNGLDRWEGEWFDGVWLEKILFQLDMSGGFIGESRGDLGQLGWGTKGNGGHDARDVVTGMPASFTKRLLVSSNT